MMTRKEENKTDRHKERTTTTDKTKERKTERKRTDQQDHQTGGDLRKLLSRMNKVLKLQLGPTGISKLTLPRPLGMDHQIASAYRFLHTTRRFISMPVRSIVQLHHARECYAMSVS